MNKLLIPLLLALLLCVNAGAQTPGYYRTTGTSSTNQYPLGQNTGSGKMQELFLPADFNTLPPSGTITKIYFRSVLANTTANYTNFKVSLLQTTATTLSNNTFLTGLTPVLAPTSTYSITTSATASTASPGWVGITLATPFTYNNAQSLIVEVQYTAYTGGPITATIDASTNIDRRIVTPTVTATSGTLQSTKTDFGMDVITAPPACVTAPTAPADNATICAGSTILSWPAVPTATGYDVLLNTGTAAPTTVVSANQSGTTYTTTVAPGPYTWKIIPKNALGGLTTCGFFNFTVNAATTASVTVAATPSSTICAGTTVTFTATPVNGGTTPAYQWKKGTTNVGTNSATYTDNALVNGDAVSVVLTGNAACATPATVTSTPITMTVVARPTATATAGGPTTFCQGGNVTLNATPATGFTYQWQKNGVDIPAATTAGYQATASGNYRVWISNGTCADTSAVIPVTVNALPTANITVSGPTTVCEGNSVVLSANTGSGYTYIWKRNGTGVGSSPFYLASVSGSYTVTITSNDCATTSAPVAITIIPGPTASITPSGPTSLCQGGNVQLCVTPISAGNTYSWQYNGNPIIPAATNACYTTANQNGAYCVRVTNTSTGCTTTACQTVVVSTPPSSVITTIGTTTFCQGGNVQLRAATGAGYTYQWYRNGIILPGATAFSYTTTVAGSYTVVITNGACVTTTTPVTITVNPLPIATATPSGPTAFCEGGSVVLSANTGAGLTYQWKNGGTIIPGETAATYTATQTGFYQVVVSNGTCSANSNFISVNVSTRPVATITPQGPTSFCQSGNVELDAPFNGVYTYQWQMDGVNIPGASNFNYIATTSGSYTVVITNGTCVATSPAQNVGIIPAPATVVTASGPLNFCQGDRVKLTANGGTGYHYQWLLNNVPMLNDTNASITVSTSGDYSVAINDVNCPATSSVFSITVNPFPVAFITVTNGNELSTGTFGSYQWYRNGVMIPGATAQNYIAAQDGYYSVVVGDAIGCSATSSIQRITSLDINNVAGNGYKVTVYPNPTAALVTIEAPQSVDALLTTIDGREVLHATDIKKLDLSTFADGIYLIKITDHKTGALVKVDKLIKGSR